MNCACGGVFRHIGLTDYWCPDCGTWRRGATYSDHVKWTDRKPKNEVPIVNETKCDNCGSYEVGVVDWGRGDDRVTDIVCKNCNAGMD
jgi:hypothetical protein